MLDDLFCRIDFEGHHSLGQHELFDIATSKSAIGVRTRSEAQSPVSTIAGLKRVRN